MNGNDVQIAARIPKALHREILKRRDEVKKQTGIEPSIADVIRMLIERGLRGKAA
jgi:hypothetical protein